MLRSCLYLGKLEHVRCTPLVHRFVYPFFTAAIDLDELATVERTFKWFSHNRWNVLSVHDADYLNHRQGSLRSRVEQILDEAYRETARTATQRPRTMPKPARIDLITHPRLFGYIFNPVNFFRCYDANGTLFSVIAQVNNTFSESHIYVLTEATKKSSYIHFTTSKEFHVSPFNDMRGQYLFYFKESCADSLDIRINIEKDETTVFTSRLSGEARPLNNRWMLQTLLQYPGSLLLTSFRITAHAARLYFGKRLKLYTKPIAASKMTFRRSGPGVVQRSCLAIGLRFLSRIRQGHIEVRCDDGREFSFGDPDSALRACITVHNYDFFVRSVLFGDVGFGESFVDKQWDCDDLPALLRIFLLNEKELDDRSILTTYFGRCVNRILHVLRPNSSTGSRKNISAHYDMSNELFASFLDSSMTYSSAYFSTPDEDLETAQNNKIERIIEKAKIAPSDHVLEIGCGWGSFAIAAAQKTGCRVTGVTLSKEQLTYAQQRVNALGLQDRIELKLCDYRELEGSFDKIVSIEMLEAVGHSFLGSFFATCDRLLADNGLLVLQVITFPDYRYKSYRYGCDWIQKYVFPGGLCPSLTALSTAASSHSRLLVEQIENIGVHYAETLARWRERFLANREQLKTKGFDERFHRMWCYYLSYCEAGFSSRTLGTLQLVMTKPHNALLGSFRAPEWE